MKRLLLAVGAAMHLAAPPNPLLAETTAKDIVNFIETAAAESPVFEFGYEDRVENEDGLTLTGVAFENDPERNADFAISVDEADFVETSTGEVSITLSSPIRYRFLARDEIGLRERVFWERHEGYRIRVREEDGALVFNLAERNVELQDRDGLSVVSSSSEVQIDLRVTPDGEISLRSRQYGSVFGGVDKADGVAVETLGSGIRIQFRTGPDKILVAHFLGEADQIEFGEAFLARVAPQFASLFDNPSSLTFNLSIATKFDGEETASNTTLEFRELKLDALGAQVSVSGDLTVVESEATPGRTAAEGLLKVIVNGGSGLAERLMRIPNKDVLLVAATLEFLFAFASPGPGGEDSKLFDVEFFRDGRVLVNGVEVAK